MIKNSSDVVDCCPRQTFVFLQIFPADVDSCPRPQHASKSTKVVGPRCYHNNLILISLLIEKLFANTQ